MIKKTLAEFFDEYMICGEIKCNLIYYSESGKDVVSVISHADIMYMKFKDNMFTLKCITYDECYDRYIIDLYLV